MDASLGSQSLVRSTSFAVLIGVLALVGGMLSGCGRFGSADTSGEVTNPRRDAAVQGVATQAVNAQNDVTDPTVASSDVTPTIAQALVTTTTTAPLEPHQLSLAVEPVGESDRSVVELTGVDGTKRMVTTPFSGSVLGPELLVSVHQEGFKPLETTIEMGQDREVTLWLDAEGQLLDRQAGWDVSGAPKQVTFTPDGTEVWTALLGGPGVEIHDPVTGTKLGAVDLPEAGGVEVIFNRSGSLAYVSQMETNSVYEIDVAARSILRTLPTGGAWSKVILLSPDEKTMWVSNWVDDSVGEIDLVTGEIRRVLRTVDTPRGLAVTPDLTKLYVAGFGKGEIEVFDLETGEGTVIHRSGGSMRHFVADHDRNRIYVSDLSADTISVIDTVTDTVSVLTKVNRKPNSIDLSPDGTVLYVSNRGANNAKSYYLPGPEWGSVVLVDTETGEKLDVIVGGNQTTGLDVSSDGEWLAFSDFLDNRVWSYRIPDREVLTNGNGGLWPTHTVTK